VAAVKLHTLSVCGAEPAGSGAGYGSRWLDEKETVRLVKVEADEPVLLRTEEVSRLLQIGRTMTFQLIANGDLPVIRIGRAVRVPRSELERWIRERTFER
jgi:excisionase family DNA binding protein